MKTIITTTLILFCIFSYAQEYKLSVNVTGINNQKGKLMVALYEGEQKFLKDPFKSKAIQLLNDEIIVVFDAVPKGDYAISLFHDENENGKLDTGIFGIPKENYAFSNNAKGFMGPAKYIDAKFTVDSNKHITINLN